MKTDAFTEMLLRNNEEEEISYIMMHGKKPHAISPIFFFSDVLNRDELDAYLERYGLTYDEEKDIQEEK